MYRLVANDLSGLYGILGGFQMKRKKRMKAIEKEVLRNRKRSYCLEYMIAHSVRYLNRYDEGGWMR